MQKWLMVSAAYQSAIVLQFHSYFVWESILCFLICSMFCSLIAMAKEGLTSMNANSKDTLQYKRHTLRQMADKWQSYFVWDSILCFLTCSMFCSLITFNAMAKEGLTSIYIMYMLR